jgi:hypothetical protein
LDNWKSVRLSVAHHPSSSTQRCRNVTCTSGNLLQHLPQSPAAASDSAAPPRDGKKIVGESVHESYVPWS